VAVVADLNAQSVGLRPYSQLDAARFIWCIGVLDGVGGSFVDGEHGLALLVRWDRQAGDATADLPAQRG